MRRAPAIVANTTVPCSAFPIAVERTPRSISPGDYPAPGTFQYPSSAPSYASFKDHMPDRELENDAPEGSLFRYDNSGPQPEFRWLQWDGNDGDAALSASLSWPGNSETYENPTVPAGDDPYPGLNAGDAASADVVRLNQALATPGPDPLARLAEHIDRQRTLRLIVWDRTMANPYPDTVKVQGFAIMRLAGYQLDASSDTWLLLELVRWDTSCGQAPAPNA